jgi:hypothetical protein
MNMSSIPLHRVALLLSSLVLLALPARAGTPEHAVAGDAALAPLAGKGHTTHTITISYDAAADPQWSYAISPANDAKKARVKRHDTIVWRCDNGSWKVFFKGPTPLANPAGQELAEVTGASGVTAGGDVDAKVKKGDEYIYGVSVLLPGASEPVIDDPRIYIEN